MYPWTSLGFRGAKNGIFEHIVICIIGINEKMNE